MQVKDISVEDVLTNLHGLEGVIGYVIYDKDCNAY